MIEFLTIISFSIFVLFIIFQMLYIFYPLFSVKKISHSHITTSKKPFSILIPAYNEEKTILQCIQGINHLHYDHFEAIIINDGSTDQTFHVLHEHLQLQQITRTPFQQLEHEPIIAFYQSTVYPKIFVLQKENGGKADALNAGIEYATYDFVITLDADSVLDPAALQAMNSAFDNDDVLAAGGMVQIAQGFNGDFRKPNPIFNVPSLIRYQIIQYISDFYLHKTTQAKLGAITVIAGAFGAFRKFALFEVQGFRKTVGEDMDITLRMQILLKQLKQPYKLIFVPNAICYTECPPTFKGLLSQRIRWQKGFLDCVLHFRKSFFRTLSIPVSIYLLVDSLFLGTVMAFFSCIIPAIIFIQQEVGMALFFLCITFLIGFYRDITSLIIKTRLGHHYSILDYSKYILFIPFDIFIFRTLGLLFVTAGSILYFINKNSWNHVERVGVHNQTYSNEH